MTLMATKIKTNKDKYKVVKCFCISMPLNETVLESYLKRVFNASTSIKLTRKTTYVPIKKVKHPWTPSRLKSFCKNTIHFPNENESTNTEKLFSFYTANISFI